MPKKSSSSKRAKISTKNSSSNALSKSSKKKNTTNRRCRTTLASALQLKEYRLVLRLPVSNSGTSTTVKFQGPRLCTKAGKKLYFTSQDRAVLGVWVHNSDLLSKKYDKFVYGHTHSSVNKREFETHKVYYQDVCKQIYDLKSARASSLKAPILDNETTPSISFPPKKSRKMDI